MLQVIVYGLEISAALSLAAFCGEKLASMLGSPQRFGWAATMVLSILLPGMMLRTQPVAVPVPAAAQTTVEQSAVTPDEPALPRASAMPRGAAPSAPVTAPPVVPEQKKWRFQPPSDRTLLLAWMVVSGVLLLRLASIDLFLHYRASRWRREIVLGRQVRVSETTGPALLGTWRPKVVVPRWFLNEPAVTQSLILQHEQQHIAARDSLLLRLALLIVAALPWNLPLWWQLHRLRQVIEQDCDARVLRAGAAAGPYCEVLLAVTQRVGRVPAGAIAMGEPVSALERRIRQLTTGPVRFSPLRTLAAVIICGAGIGVALALEAPAVPGNAAQILVRKDAPALPPPGFQYASIDTPPTNDAASMAISPDGRQLAFVALDEGRNRLWVQDIGTGAMRVFAGTNEVRWPFWSPDGKDIGFFNNDQVWRVDVATGKTQVIVPSATWAAGGSWGPNGVILYGRYGAMSILRTSAGGGGQRSVTNYPGQGQLAHFHPFFLPDGNHFLYFVEGSAAVRGVYLGSMTPSSGSSTFDRVLSFGARLEPDRRLVDAEAAGVYAMGRLFFVKDEMLLAQAFDPATLSLSGSPQVVARDIAIGGRGGAALSAAGDHVIYRTGAAGSTQQLTWFDRSGTTLGTIGDPFVGGAGAMSISPDGTHAVVNRNVDAVGDIFTVDLATGVATQVTNFPANNSYPIWSSDSKSVVFSSNLMVIYQTYRQAAGTANAELVFQNTGWRHPMDMTRDGRYLIYRTNTPDLWALDTRTQQEIPVIRPGSGTAYWPQISPDGRWFAYESSDLGGVEIYLHGPFDPPGTGQRSKPVSISDGGWPRWRADGRELYYVAADGSLMAVTLSFDAGGNSFTAAAPVKLFNVPMNMGSISKSLGQQYMPDQSGKRFLVLAAVPAKSPVHVLRPLPRK